ncbi:PTS fructose transporter subunit IIB [Agarivorans sp. MS3-6]|uniref:PTS fructose transporter subunit IIB n=1 Tax=Agarivorans TaxID=261825 RepID=UPI00128E31C6|nr:MULTISPECIES: PTS fructose transporter subunit IIB [Agarivorans]MPW31472.1 PTS fructose transporter subunit IIB [Agarivorans sp. B2Z047]UQN42514.1 PTS fructose transporter subunit IIB [Agarivorans sp. B2Z047]
MNVVAITACPTGIAHTYMAADKLVETARKLSIGIKVETQGAMGVENKLTPQDISHADVVLIVADIRIQGAARFDGKPQVNASIQESLQQTQKLILRCKSMVS